MRDAPDLPWAGHIHNAVDARRFPYRGQKADYLLFLGSMAPEKGAHLAIDAARSANRRILIAGSPLAFR